MHLLVLGNFALLALLGVASFFGVGPEAAGNGVLLTEGRANLAAMPWVEVQERLLPLVAGFLLLGVTYSAAWRGWRRQSRR